MRKLWTTILIWWYWIIGKGPWLVVGQYHDDDGKLRRFITAGEYRPDPLSYASLDEANDYCQWRNDRALTDPLGTTYYVWHELEYKENK